MRNLLRRSFSGLIYVILFVSAILYSKESFITLTCIFSIIAIWEFHKMLNIKNVASYLFFGASIFLLLKKQDSFAALGTLIITVLSSSFLMYLLFSKKEITTTNSISKLSLTIRYIIFSLCFLILLPFNKGAYNPYIILNVLILIWVNDSFAFLVGKNIGKNKLFESVSPKKTIEGFIGGLIFAMLAGCIISKYAMIFSPLNWIIIAIIISIIGTIGDLIESKFKRQANVKDSGNIMPGHGGILDRLDSLLFAAPFVYLYINFII